MAWQALKGGELTVARSHCERVLTLAPNEPQALYILGVVHFKQGDDKTAEPLLERARAFSPANVAVLNSLGEVYFANGKKAESIAVLQDAVNLQPTFVWAQYNLAVAWRSIGDIERCKHHLAAALAYGPEFPPALAGLAEIAAYEDREEEAQDLADRALRRAPTLFAAWLVKAVLALREAKYSEVLDYLSRMDIAERVQLERRVSYYYLRAQACEGLGRNAEAFEAYRAAARLLSDAHREKFENAPNISSFTTIEAVQEFAPKEEVARWRHPPITGPVPVFLVGYPRSGTTLLDQVLASHPQIQTLEENQNFGRAYRELIQSPGGFDRWAGLTDEEILSYRADYWSEVRAALGGMPNRQVFVDKMPLNTVLLPLIHRLFPGAKIIFALRDPRDVVISCFTQRFRMNAAMYHFLSLENTVRHYDGVMRIAEIVRRRFPLSFHDIRYEDLVFDFDKTAAALLTFLGLPWDERVRDYVSTAKSRQINTPSAPDVRLPLYRTSIGRWRKFASETAEAFAALEPWIKAYGYDQA